MTSTLDAEIEALLDGLVVEAPPRIYVKRSPRTAGHQKSHIVFYDAAHTGMFGKTICGMEYKLGAWVEVKVPPIQHLCTHCDGISHGDPMPSLQHGDVKWDEADELWVYCVYCNTWMTFVENIAPDQFLIEHVGEMHD